jgi:hypothetical protein
MSFSVLSQTGGYNTGEILGDPSRGVLKKIFIFNDVVGSADYADAATFLAFLVAASKKSATDAGKLFPLPEAQDISDKSQANKEGSLGLGFTQILQEGKPAYEVKVFAGNITAQQLRKFNNQIVRVLEFDANDKVWGAKSGTDFQGFKAKLFFTGGKIATGQNVEEGVITFTLSILSNSEYFDSARYMSIDGEIEDVVGLVDADAEFVSKSSNAHKVKFFVPTSKMGEELNLGDEFSTELASASLFDAFTGASFATSLAITSVAWDSATKSFVVTFDSTAYSALSAGAKIKLVPKSPVTLDAAGVDGVEIGSIILTK